MARDWSKPEAMEKFPSKRIPLSVAIEEALKSANFKVDVVDDARSMVWSKLIINAAINPLTALLKVPNGELLERPSRAQIDARVDRRSRIGCIRRKNYTCHFVILLLPWKTWREKRRRIIRPCCRIFSAARRLRSTRSAAQSFVLDNGIISQRPSITPAGNWCWL